MLYKDGKYIGYFCKQMRNVFDIINDQSKVYHFNEFNSEGSTGDTKPSIIVALSLLHSIFTMKEGDGEVSFQIKSWVKGSSEQLDPKNYAKIQLLDQDDKES